MHLRKFSSGEVLVHAATLSRYVYHAVIASVKVEQCPDTIPTMLFYFTQRQLIWLS
jgi:hypothetical protein